MNRTADLNSLRYPTGNYKKPEKASAELIQSWIDTIESFPEKIKSLTHELDTETLNHTYRPGGWTIRQCRQPHECLYSL